MREKRQREEEIARVAKRERHERAKKRGEDEKKGERSYFSN